MIAIVDYGMGNLRSLSNAFAYLGVNSIVTSDPQELANAERLVLPGVGAFGDAMRAIDAGGLRETLTRQVCEVGKPILGICLGMQLFARGSTEHGEHAGLGWIDAEIVELDPGSGLKVPHVGWNNLNFRSDDWLFQGIRPAEANFYFVHSFHMICRDKSDLLATADYGGNVTAAIRRDNLVAFQFHPEKSQDNGLRLLGNWVSRRM